MKAIQTIYKSTQYRSSLEAKWAVMFELLGWRVQYEPYDLPGWIPDFEINEAQRVLCEVRPYLSLKEWEDRITEIGRAAPQGVDVLLLSHDPSCCYLGEAGHDGTAFWPERGYDRAIWTWRGDRIGLTHECLSYKDRITGVYDGNQCGIVEDLPPALMEYAIDDLWAEACNRTQWSPSHQVNSERRRDGYAPTRQVRRLSGT